MAKIPGASSSFGLTAKYKQFPTDTGTRITPRSVFFVYAADRDKNSIEFFLVFAAIEISIIDGFEKMVFADVGSLGQVGDGAGHFQNPVICTGA